jgi:hypothetical protein
MADLFGHVSQFESELLMKPLCSAICVVMTIAGLGMLGWAGAVLAAEPMVATQPPSEFRVPVDLFKTWNFDKDPVEQTPVGFSSFSVGSEGGPMWMVAEDPGARTPPHLLKQSAPCSEECFQVLVVDALQYDYLDLIVRIRLADTSGTSNGSAGVVFGVRDRQNYYAVTVDQSGKDMQVIRMQDGKATTLAQAEIAPKQVVWHLLRVRRNTIISKEYIEVFFDGLQVFSVEDRTFGTGQIGLVTRGPATAEFDNLTAAPLYSQKPLSGPAAY